jgi:hypothetical protein
MVATAEASLGMLSDGNGTIAAARQRTQPRLRIRHGDTKGANAYTDACLAPHPAPFLSRYAGSEPQFLAAAGTIAYCDRRRAV